MNRKELIEEAAKAMAPPLIFDGTFTEYSRAYDNHRVSDRGADQAYWLILARAALAVFEKAQCKRCGKLAEGYAFINGDRYCHPDDGVDCYTLENHGL